MLNRLILKVTKFQLPPPKLLGTVVKNIFFGGGGYHGPPRQIGLRIIAVFFYRLLYRTLKIQEVPVDKMAIMFLSSS